MSDKKLNKRERLEREIFQKKAQLADLNARDRAKERKRDTRRKIIAGALTLQHAGIDQEFKKKVDALLDQYVVSDHDRSLFGLAPKI